LLFPPDKDVSKLGATCPFAYLSSIEDDPSALTLNIKTSIPFILLFPNPTPHQAPPFERIVLLSTPTMKYMVPLIVPLLSCMFINTIPVDSFLITILKPGVLGSILPFITSW